MNLFLIYFMQSLSKSSKHLILRASMIFILMVFFGAIIFMTNQPPSNTEETKYLTYLEQYQKKYSKDQATYRQFLFYQTYDDIVFNNKQLDSSFQKGLNQFSDLTEEEFQQMYLIATSVARIKNYLEIAQFEDNLYFDWEYLMTPVKDMRDFDGSHIFSVTAVLEFQLNKQNVLRHRAMNQTVKLQQNWITVSEQQIIDCCETCLDKKVPKSVYTHIELKNISLDKNYPYVSSIHNSKPQACKTANQSRPFRIQGWYSQTGCGQLSKRLTKGPAVVWVDARKWRSYEGGIFSECSETRNHYAVAVGRGIGYWKVRNSWGRRWGERGHIRLKSGTTCGICTKISWASLNQAGN